MSKIQILALIVLAISGLSYFFHTYVNKEKLFKSYTYYHRLKSERNKYDWDRTIKRTKNGYLICFLASLISLMMSHYTNINEKFYLILIILSLLIFVFLSRPAKKSD